MLSAIRYVQLNVRNFVMQCVLCRLASQSITVEFELRHPPFLFIVVRHVMEHVCRGNLHGAKIK